LLIEWSASGVVRSLAKTVNLRDLANLEDLPDLEG